MATQKTYIARKDQDVEFADGDFSGAVAVTGNVTVGGTLTVTGAETHNGAQTFSGAVTVGVDDTGYDVKFFGATSGVFWLWDESADTVVRDGGTIFVKAVASGDGGITVSSDGMFADPETATEAGFITIDVAGTTYEVPFYASS